MQSMNVSNDLQVTYQAPASLSPHLNNPRKHSRKQIRQIAESIRNFGFIAPVIADASNMLIAGHGRVLAAKELKLEQVPVIRVEHLNEMQIRAYMIADNKLTENSTWDKELLKKSMLDLSLADINFDIGVTGFEIGEIDFMLAPTVEEKEDELVSLMPDKPVCQPGDLWLLGDHRLYCGNSLDAQSYTTLMRGEKADIVVTDPPYNVPIEGHVSGLGKEQHREFTMASGEMSNDQFRTFLFNCISLMAQNSKEGSIHYLFMDWRHLGDLTSVGGRVYSTLKNICVWVKNQGGMGSLYRSQHEMVAVFKHGNKPHRNNVQLGKHGRNRTNVWEYPSVSSFGRLSEEGKLLAMHPTVKPTKLIADAIIDASSRGDIVLDPFIGSGTAIIAAERVHRRCYGIEIDPLYADTAIRRWENLTGEQAIHAVTGAHFE